MKGTSNGDWTCNTLWCSLNEITVYCLWDWDFWHPDKSCSIDFSYIILVQKSIGALTKVKLNTPQLTLAKLTQSGRYQSGSQEVPSSIPSGGIFLLNSFCSSLFKSLLPTLPTLYTYGKTRMDQQNNRWSLCFEDKRVSCNWNSLYFHAWNIPMSFVLKQFQLSQVQDNETTPSDHSLKDCTRNASWCIKAARCSAQSHTQTYQRGKE